MFWYFIYTLLVFFKKIESFYYLKLNINITQSYQKIGYTIILIIQKKYYNKF